MKFIADVNIAQLIIKLLRQDSHDVLDIKSVDPETTDTKIIKLAVEERGTT